MTYKINITMLLNEITISNNIDRDQDFRLARFEDALLDTPNPPKVLNVRHTKLLKVNQSPTMVLYRAAPITILGSKSDFEIFISFIKHKNGYAVCGLMEGNMTPKKFIEIDFVGLHSNQRGKGLAYDMYKLLIDVNGIRGLVSDQWQSPGGKAIWRKLALDPDISVYAYTDNKVEPLYYDTNKQDLMFYNKPNYSVYNHRDIRLVAIKTK